MAEDAEDKTSWSYIIKVSMDGVHMNPQAAYVHCHELWYNDIGSVHGLLEAICEYQCVALNKLPDDNLESFYGTKYPIHYNEK